MEPDHGCETSGVCDPFACDEVLHFFIAHTKPVQGYLDIDQSAGRLAFPLAVMSDPAITLDEKRHSLEHVHRHLDPGASLVFDVDTGIMSPRHLTPAGEVKKGGLTYRRLVGSKIEEERSVLGTLIFASLREGQIIDRVKQTSGACIESEEVRNLLLQTTPESRRQFGDEQGFPWDPASSVLITETAKGGRL